MTESRVYLFIKLVEKIIHDNRDKLNSARLRISVNKLSIRHPVLDNIKIHNDLTIHSGKPKYEDVPDKDETMVAVQAVLVAVYKLLKVLVGPADAKRRLREPTKEFISRNWKDMMVTGLDRFLPQLSLLDEVKVNLESLGKKPREVQVAKIFERLFSNYLNDLTQTIAISTYQRKVATLSKDDPLLQKLDIKSDGTVNIGMEGENVEDVVRALAGVFDSFVDIISFAFGVEGALERAKHIVLPTLEIYGGMPDELGITSYILKGALSKTVRCNIKGLDKLFPGGLARGTSLLLLMPSGPERKLFMDHVVKADIQTGASLMVALSSDSVAAFRSRMKEMGVRTKGYEDRAMLKLIDWHSFRDERVVGVEEQENILKSSRDLTHLGIAFDMSLKKIANAPTKRGVVEVISPALKMFDSQKVYSFCEAVKDKLKDAEVTTIFIVEKELHDPRTLASLQQLFDGVLDVEKEKGARDMQIALVSMRGSSVESKYYPLVLMKKRIEVVVEDDEKKAKKKKGAKAKKEAKAGPGELTKADEAKREKWKQEAVILVSQKKFKKALRAFDKALAIDPGDETTWYGRGVMSLHGLEDPDIAIESFKAVLDLDPKFYDAWYHMGKAHYMKQELDQATKMFIRAKRGHSNFHWYSTEEILCPTCAEVLKKDAAECPTCGEELTPVVEAEPEKQEPALEPEEEVEYVECPNCQTVVEATATECPGCGAIFAMPGEETVEEKRDLVQCLKEASKAQDWDYALECIDGMIAEDDDEKNFLKKGAILAKLERHNEALDAYKEILKRNPKNVDVLFHVGKTLYAMGRFKNAIKYTRLYLKANPKSKRAEQLIKDCQDAMK